MVDHHVEKILTECTPGNFITDNKKMLKIATADGYVHVHELQLQGRPFYILASAL